MNFRKVNDTDIVMLCSKFREVEILETLNQCGGSKSPGPDGFNFNFIKHNWEIIGEDIKSALFSFYESGYIPRDCNASFITLIPKCENPSELGDYRPISLVGCVYKLILKILANRLKRVLEKVIDKNQSVFLSGRGLLDSVLIFLERKG